VLDVRTKLGVGIFGFDEGLHNVNRDVRGQ
jgi:hypothetical protein